jgi:predicted molibdopterin-dependent oxidoreductase YjgC
MDFRDRDDLPLVKWNDPQSAFDAWKQCSAGRPCDYTGLTYAALGTGSGIQWPCTVDRPEGTERLYADGRFWSDADYCESYGKDLATGTPMSAADYRSHNPDAKAMIKPAHYARAVETPDDSYPLALITGRTLYHFHTRTKTARSAALNAAAPEVWLEVSAPDARRCAIREGDLVEVSTRRGSVRARARVSGVRPGVVFLPFHFGYWDAQAPTHDRAANELTLTEWDPSSKQPIFKMAAARIRLIASGRGPAPAPTVGASAPTEKGIAATLGGPDGMAAEWA